MSVFSQSSEPSRRTGRRAQSLARHIFGRVAFPMGIVFLSCFSVLDQLIQIQLRDHMRQELLTADAQAHRANKNDDARLSRSIPALAEAAGIPQALRGKSGKSEEALAEKLLRLGESLDEDVYAVFGAGKQPIITLRRQPTALGRSSQIARMPETERLAEVDGEHYFLTTYPLQADGEIVGRIVAGRHWLREMPLGQGTYVLARQGKVLQAAGNRVEGSLAAGMMLPVCTKQVAACEVEINGKRNVLFRSAASGENEEIGIYMLRSLDLMGSPMLSMTRGIMLAGAFLSILGALGLALLTGRAVSQSLKDITVTCLRAQKKGDLSEIEIPPSHIREVDTLGQTLQSAVRSIEAGQTQLTQAYSQFMGVIAALLDARDTYTAGHSHRVSAYSEALARDFGLPKAQIDDIRVGALLHDIGKIGVPDEVLRKHERLTTEEFDLMKQHTTIGRKVLEPIERFGKYLDTVELHHENLDGTGYPRGLRGDQIPISARIVKVADVYDALTTDRPYRKKLSTDEVHQILRDGAGKHFDRLLVEIFLTRSLPSFGRRSDLEQLYIAVGAPQARAPEKKAVGA